jgi:hypothetical protein
MIKKNAITSQSYFRGSVCQKKDIKSGTQIRVVGELVFETQKAYEKNKFTVDPYLILS